MNYHMIKQLQCVPPSAPPAATCLSIEPLDPARIQGLIAGLIANWIQALCTESVMATNHLLVRRYYLYYC